VDGRHVVLDDAAAVVGPARITGAAGLEVEAGSALLFPASLGNLGVLGDRYFLRCFAAVNLCVQGPKKGLIAEDAEVAEARREKK
jgi:hypothetical protein